ncbi:protein disulfide isomerase family protein [Telluribacter sp. SYSU D00476]|uniref:protein disulfide isomerase family protein n=1 Tax=Telluribacter sp. SYSU D00476 TaxID=2811430 RepID=UPI001FF1212C|nr:thioredoxin family protein [Telluribacter sp. SYSU D00476]
MFKKVSICLFLVIGTLTLAMAQGVQFTENNLRNVFNQARVQNKLVFVEVYSSTCHVCQSFIPIFNQKQVGDFYNQSFANYKIEVNSPDFQQFILAKKIFVPSLPLLLYFDGNQNLQHLAVIEPSAQNVLQQGQIALNPGQRASSMRQRFAAGERANQFLIDLGMYSRVVSDTAMNLRAMDAYAKQQPQNAYQNETNFLVLQRLVMDVDNPMATYFINHLPEYSRKYDPKLVQNTAENIIMYSLFSSRGNKYSSSKVLQMREYLTKAGIGAQVARNRVLLPLLNAYLREKKAAEAVAVVNTHATQVPMKAPDYIYLIRYFNEKSPNASYVPSAQNWFNNGLKTVGANSKEASDLHYQMAVAYKKAGKKAEATRTAQRSVAIAKAAKVDSSQAEALLRSI